MEVIQMARKVLWEEMRRTEFERALKDDAIVIIPVASTEQHGEHLPVNTDTNACFVIAQRAAQAISDFPVLILPPIWTGYSHSHMGYPGTITLRYNTFVQLLTEVAVSVYQNGFRKILFLNGHGGNVAVIDALKRKLVAEDGVPGTAGYTWWQMPLMGEAIKSVSDSGWDSVDHAGEIETSIQLYLQPDLVDKNAAVWVKGVFGDPSKGTCEKGERLIKSATDTLVEILRYYHSGKLLENDIWGKKVVEGRKEYYV
jgi:creatinine amidohydrolase